MTGQGRHRGVGLALGAAVLFGLSAPLAKRLLGSTTPQLLAGLLYLGSGVGLVGVWGARRRQRGEAPLARADAPWLVGAILFGGVLGPLLLMVGLSRTPAAVGSLLLNAEGVLTAALAWFVFRENFDRRIALGMAAIVAGGIVLSWGGPVHGNGLLGPLAIVGACLSWAIDNNLTQKVSGGDPVAVAMLKGLVAGVVNTAIALALGARWPAPALAAGAMGLGFLSYGVSLTLFVLALRHLGTARTGAYFSLAPFVGAAVSLLMFRERPTPTFAGGAALMGLGVWFHLTERHSHEHTHATTAHEHAHRHDDHHQHRHGAGDAPGTDPTPHSHRHVHQPITHAHPHYPDLHHRHRHGEKEIEGAEEKEEG
ncbi:MAG: DMT family transporter [Gemmatimonadaceae bacterium]